MQEDTYHGDGLNLYAYVGNNPVRYVDPSGHCKVNGVERGSSSRQILSGEEWYQYFKEQYGAENVQGSAYNWPQQELQSAVDSIHAAGYNGEPGGRFRDFGGSNPITITVNPNGTVIVSKNNGRPNIDSISKAKEIFGNDVVIVEGRGKNYSGSTTMTNNGFQILSNHSEVRGIQESNIRFGTSQDSKQVCSHYSCDSCATVQRSEGVMNYTGYESGEAFGKISRRYSKDIR